MRFSFDGVHGEITTLPGCTQVAVSHNVFSSDPGKGKATEANRKRCDAMFEMGYDYALCTVADNNQAQLRILERNGWTWLQCFVSRKTGHQVRLYGKRLYV